MKNIIKVFFFLILLTGLIYPLMTTVVGQTFFSDKTKGSLVEFNGKIVGSSLLAQEFKSDRYFHPRPSAINYDPMASGASNFGPISKALKSQIDQKVNENLSAEMLFNSGSGLDPHISVETALKQVETVSIARKFNSEQKQRMIGLVYTNIEKSSSVFFGRELINVLKLNLLLEKGI